MLELMAVWQQISSPKIKKHRHLISGAAAGETAFNHGIERAEGSARSGCYVTINYEVFMTDEEILKVFERKGMRIELGAQFSARGQIAALLDAAKEISKESYIRGSNDCYAAMIGHKVT